MISRLTPEQQRKLAIALATALVLIVGWRLGGPQVAAWWSGDSDAVQREAQRSQLSGIEVVDIRLDALEGAPATYTPDRDLFRYPPPKPKPRPVVKPPPPPPPPVEETEYKPPPPIPPQLPYDLLGIFGPERRRIAALKEGEEIVNALESQTLKDKFIVYDIGFDTVEFRYVGFSEHQNEILSVQPERR